MAFVVTLPSGVASRVQLQQGAAIRPAQVSRDARRAHAIVRAAIAPERAFFGSCRRLVGAATLLPPLSRPFLVAQAEGPAPNVNPLTGAPRTDNQPVPVVQKTPIGVDMFNYAVEAGVKKSKMPNWRVFVLSMMAGAFVAVAMTLNLAIFGHLTHADADFSYGLAKAISALLFPFGLFLVLVYGVEMFTTNTMYMTTSTLEGKTTWVHLARSWAVSWCGNFVGAALMAMLCNAAGMFAPGPVGHAFAHVAEAKALQPASRIFFKGILANWLVCTATYGSLASRDMISKAATIWLPVCSFVFLGFEHSVANMFTLPAGMLAGGAITAAGLAHNLLWSSLGNALGGAVLVGAAVWLGHRALHSHH
eukprot:tig00001239_g7768.t1